MVRTLATMLLAHIPKPSKRDCEHIAKSLVRKHSFLKEYVSHYTKCIAIRYVHNYVTYSILGLNLSMYSVKTVIVSQLVVLKKRLVQQRRRWSN